MVCAKKIGGDKLKEAEAFVQDITLDYDDRNVMLEISALNYALPNNTLYYYKLVSDGDADKQEWNVATRENYMIDALRRAIELVERNISTSGYSVEQLSADLCMERTGLYKKMTAIMEKTPSAFIRSIRMQKAAGLLKTGKYTVSEVAMRTGFSSTSHFCRVFVSEYGCTPGEYTKTL